MDNIIPPNTPLKQCTGPCGQFFPATTEYFHRNGKTYLHPHCKTCRNAHKQALNALPNEKVKQQARNKAYRKAHKEELATYQINYQEANRERLNEYCKEYHQTHRDEQNERFRLYHQTHKEQRNSHQRAYSQGRPIENRLANQKRKAICKAIPGTLTPEQIQNKIKAQHYACYYCFTKFEKRDGKYIFQLDHTIPISRTEAGPRHDVNYIVLACPTCNNRKKAKLPHEWAEGGRLF